jgi:hypothetical protein
MERRWIIYSCIVFLLCMAVPGNASTGETEDRASALAADYQTLDESAARLSMNAGDVVIEARLSLDENEIPQSIRHSLFQIHADTSVVSDLFHSKKWLHITCRTSPGDVYRTAHGILDALDSIPPDEVRLSLNARWDTDDTYSTSRKKEIIQALFTCIDARTVASMADERMVSASGFSPCLTSHAGTGQDKMNITASVCPGENGRGTVLWLGTPVLTVEY